MKALNIILYNEPSTPQINIRELERFLTDAFAVNVTQRNEFFNDKKILDEIKSCRVYDLKKPFDKNNLADNHTINEKELALYDGFEIFRIAANNMAVNESTMDTLHVIFTDKLFGTFDEQDRKYHARAIICSNPAIISTTGMIEALAKPKQYYMDLLTNAPNKETDKILQKYDGEFLKYNDSRFSKVIKGYLLQAVLYYETGDAFCKSDKCRLYNSHWQKEMLSIQIKDVVCKKHRDILDSLKA